MASKNPKPYESWGNGSAMRIAPVGWVANTPEEVIELSDKYTLITHNHPEAIDAARATSLSVFYARQPKTPDEIRQLLSEYYVLDYSIDDIRAEYKRTERAKDSVPQAISTALEATSYEDAIRLAVSLAGDTDTQAAIAGGIAEATFGVPENIKNQTLCYLDDDLTNIVMDFYKQF